MAAINNVAPFQDVHGVTLQGLDQWLPYKDTSLVPGGMVFYHTSHFEGTEKEWNGTPIVFIPHGKPVRHVEHDKFARDPYGEAQRLGYRIAGTLNNTRVLSGAEVRLVADANIDDPEVSRLVKEKKLSLSTGFDVQINNDGMMQGKVRPNHVLVFTKCSTGTSLNCGIPNDKTVSFNNTDGTGTGDPFEESDRLIQMQVEQYGRAWIAEREGSGQRIDLADPATAQKFAGVIQAKRDQLINNVDRSDLIRRARGIYNPITHMFGAGDVHDRGR